MPFREVNIDEELQKELNSDPEFREAWESSRMEYAILGDLVKLRNAKGLTQAELAERVGSNQRVISRIEKHDQSPTLKTLCCWAEALHADIKIIPRQR